MPWIAKPGAFSFHCIYSIDNGQHGINEGIEVQEHPCKIFGPGLRGLHMPLSLSGGEQQRVGIARAVVARPRILLADEPTGNLDPALSAEIMQLFEEFNQVGVTVLIASHDLALISRLRHRILTLDEGRLVTGGEL